MLPPKVNIAGIEYVVREVEGINDRFNTLGMVNYARSVIEIDSDMSKTKKEQIFIHEVLHACFSEAGFDKQDEDVINRVGIVLYQVLKDNKLTF
ncbi:ImmA/IrrE family metallo-endopeptidase [Virgibacillus halodenitrificans]|uniref:ImmA/IrrE family metallo-endopeptidase n=1 Tax=Virgibacillus halodenitrificans TaxID=1482 RepID=UPI001371B905|nr:ImmA/IrrE family metallo-endopeptidase [Virgibacillus halodenitrificans]MYL44596.1 ImmA/IrrE family metallo-endopeptidase [Virgibacillus halodenitrificans]